MKTENETVKFACPLETIFPESIMAADKLLKNQFQTSGFDNPLLWEGVVATHIGGKITAHQEGHDVESFMWGKLCRIEVKFSKAFQCRFAPIKGKDMTRRVFKWTKFHSLSKRRDIDAFVLIGLDENDLVYAWVIPAFAISLNTSSATFTAPSNRQKGGYRSALIGYLIYFDQLLPCVARACHLAYDADQHRRSAQLTRHTRRAIRDFFDD